MDLDAFLDKTCGFDQRQWEDATTWLTRRLRLIASSGGLTYYGVLCQEMSSAGLISLDPHGAPFAVLLGQINIREHDAGRPLLSALVLTQESGRPGIGFWNISRDMGLESGDTEDEHEAFWASSLAACHTYWRGRPATTGT